MDIGVYRREFEKLAERLNIEVRYTAGGPSGLCILKGERVLFIDKNLDQLSKVEVFAQAFKPLDLNGVYIVPALRRLLGMDKSCGSW